MQARLTTPLLVMLVSAGCFLALTLAVLAVHPLPLDADVRTGVLSLATPPVVAALRVANLAGNWRLLLPGTLLLLGVFPGARRRWWIWVGLMVCAPLLEGLFKLLVARARPEDASYGFPSGHATAAAAFFGAIMYLAGSLPPAARRAARALALLGIVLVAIARVVLRAHWPSDAVGGIALGLGLAAAAGMVNEMGGRDRPRER